MPPLWSYRLLPQGPFHFGLRGVGLEEVGEFCPSDTLFSALCLALREAEGQAQLDSLLAECLAGAPPFRISSAFPFAGQVQFFPTPPLDNAPKGVRWVSRQLLAAALEAGQWPADPSVHLWHDGAVAVLDQEATLLPRRARGEPARAPTERRFWATQEVARVTVSRVDQAAALFHSGQLWFGPQCGLFILAAAQTDHSRDILTEGLALVGQRGLGGERGAGYGFFTVDGPEEVEWPLLPGADLWYCLSYFHPTEPDLTAGVLGPAARYRISVRRGWCASPERARQRWRSVRMVEPGSVLVGAWDGAWGDLVDVTPALPADGPDHRVYRWGFGFGLPARVGREA